MKPSNVHNFYGTTQALQRYFLYASDAMNLSPKCPLEVGIICTMEFCILPLSSALYICGSTTSSQKGYVLTLLQWSIYCR